MGFNLKTRGEIFGINEELSEWGSPVFEKDDLEPGILGESNKDGTIFIKEGISEKEAEITVSHERVHQEQMQQNRWDYTDNEVTWKKDTKSPARKYTRAEGMIIDNITGNRAQEGGDFPWEREAYKKQ
jgi:hypothetical protein|tara:strand:+ start:237 stop:620 length:384 start_codon:yes stop_codon:yes gene_type:complete